MGDYDAALMLPVLFNKKMGQKYVESNFFLAITFALLQNFGMGFVLR